MSKNTFFYRTPPGATSEQRQSFLYYHYPDITKTLRSPVTKQFSMPENEPVKYGQQSVREYKLLE